MKGTSPAHRDRATTVALIGVDGSGKSTLLAGLAAALTARGLRVHIHKTESGRSGLDRLAERCGRDGLADLVGSETASLMQAAIGWRSLREAKPLLREAGRVVLFDRHIACHLALTHLRSPAVLDEVRAVFSPFRPPDLTLFVTVTPAVAVQRLSERGGTAHDAGFLERFQGAYRRVLDGLGGAVVELDGDLAPDAVLNNALAALPVGLVEPMTGPVERMTGRVGRAAPGADPQP